MLGTRGALSAMNDVKVIIKDDDRWDSRLQCRVMSSTLVRGDTRGGDDFEGKKGGGRKKIHDHDAVVDLGIVRGGSNLHTLLLLSRRDVFPLGAGFL